MRAYADLRHMCSTSGFKLCQTIMGVIIALVAYLYDMAGLSGISLSVYLNRMPNSST